MIPAPEAGRDPAASVSRSRLPQAPREIGPFRIKRLLGEGGMGVVFLAQQERPSRMVALKVIHASLLTPRTLARFEQEAEVLARLQHPGIAQIYQVGTYDTEQGVLPYIAMEYVEGERLDHFATRRAPALRARLELAARIADAVEHAHQKGVIHRDLKPGNILVTAEGQPKILDFGVARLSDDDTRTTTLRTDVGALLGTLSYMSPEQAGGDPQAIDARSDVYSLGVVLYELLTGRLPYYVDRAALPEAVRVIQQEEPTKLSTHARTLRGDVETIVLKALEKDRERRYPSAQALADDIRRHLTDVPIHARRPSTWYQLSKFARRNQVLVGGVAAVLLTLLAGVTVATHLYLEERAASAGEREARLRAETGERHAQAAADFLVSLFESIDPEVARGADTQLLQRILADARGRLASELADQPEVEARIRKTLGTAYTELTLFDEAESELRRAVELCTTNFGADDRRTLEAASALASLLVRRGQLAQAEEAQRATLERQELSLGAADRDTLETKRELGDSLMRQGRQREAEQLLRETLAEQVERFGADDPDAQSTRVALAQTLGFQSKHAEARELLEQVLLDRDQRLGADHPATIVALAELGSTLDDLGELAESESALRDALERARRVYGPDNQQTLSILNNLSISLEAAGKPAAAEEVLRDCLERRQRVFGAEHVETLNTLNHLVTFLWSQGRADEAAALIPGLLETTLRVLGEGHRETLRARYSTALLYGLQHRQREAAEQFAEIVARDREILRPDDPQLSRELYNWAATLQNSGDDAAAEPILRDLLRLIDEHGLAYLEFVPAARNALAKVLEEKGENAAADELFQAALGERRRRFPGDHQEIAYSLSDYGEAILERGDPEGAEPLLAELVRMQQALRTADDWKLASARQLYGRCLAQLGRFDEAEAQLVPACETFARSTDALPSAARAARSSIRELYELWDEAEPGQEIAARAERWQTAFPVEE